MNKNARINNDILAAMIDGGWAPHCNARASDGAPIMVHKYKRGNDVRLIGYSRIRSQFYAVNPSEYNDSVPCSSDYALRRVVGTIDKKEAARLSNEVRNHGEEARPRFKWNVDRNTMRKVGRVALGVAVGVLCVGYLHSATRSN